MTESDDPITLLLIGGAAAGGAAAGGAFSSRDKSATPAIQADNKKTATALPQGTEAARTNRLRRAAQLPGGFKPPQLGTPGLLGLTL